MKKDKVRTPISVITLFQIVRRINRKRKDGKIKFNINLRMRFLVSSARNSFRLLALLHSGLH